jgi:comEA protein
MKALHLLLVAIFTFSFSLPVLYTDVQAATEKKEVAAPADNANAPLIVTPDEKKRAAKATKASKGIPKDVNINTADKEMLILLPGIGPVTAEAILAYRRDNGNFKSIDELRKVKGIGEKHLAKLKPFLQVI